MTNKKMVWPVAALMIAGVTLASLTVQAKDEKELSGEYNVSKDTQVNVESGVGTITFVRGEGDELTVQITAEADNDSFWNDGDLSAVELVADERGDRLTLSVPEDENVKLDWVITMPRVAGLDVELGVGALQGEVWTTETTIEVGVGQIDLKLYGADIREINAEAGIGDTKLRGFGDVRSERAMVSSESRASGSGKATVSAEVGVGDITIEVDGR